MTEQPFLDKLNALTLAASADRPKQERYAQKREEVIRYVADLSTRLRAAERDAATLAAIKEVLRCDYDVVAISLAESDWERGYEACHRVVERTIRDRAALAGSAQEEGR
jgi:hypothetical protein